MQLCFGYGPGPGLVKAFSVGTMLVGIYVALRLCYLVVAHTPFRKSARVRRIVLRLVAIALAIVTIVGQSPVAVRDPLLSMWAFYVAIGWLSVETCRYHGIGPTALGLSVRLSHDPASRKTATRLTLVGMVAGTALTNGLLWGLRLTGTDSFLPVMAGSQAHTLQLTSLGSVLLTPAGAVVMEDLVVVGATTALLTAARRPPWVIYLLITVIEVALHGYYGLPAIGMAIYAVLRTMAYQRTRQLLVMIGIHAAWDLVGGLVALANQYGITRYHLLLDGLLLYAVVVLPAELFVRARKKRRNRPHQIGPSTEGSSIKASQKTQENAPRSSSVAG
ncbi:CPBP family intramembrane metalloprotease [Streptomyces sp. 8L]|uniref:CPBP family intramembrane metalloprotease n=1 Tax=Streptomyces sp. 8L TaxID=2877242 RepID=UPI001CD478B3|nr:CPBP family intramembrane metalloprotease [Streptomyces sp. 8L]MCA1220053.1 CPBP family intramembrane metalloprotease [Streptomyces sp. 8L]